MNAHAQGTIEYLVILAVIVVVALVVVTLMVNSTAPAGQISETQSKLYWQNQAISIVDASVDSEGDAFITVNPNETITLTSMTIDNEEIEIPETKVFQGNNQTILLEGLISCSGNSGTYTINEIRGITENGLPIVVSEGQIVIECSEDISPDTIISDNYIDTTSPAFPGFVAFATAPGYDFATDVKLGSGGDIYVTGGFRYSMDFGDSIHITAPDYDTYVARLDKDTNDWVWAIAVGGAGYPFSMSIDSQDNIYVASDSGLTKINSSGAIQWTESFSSGSIRDVEVVSNGDIYVTGLFGGTGVTLGTFNLTSNGINEIFIAKMNSSRIYQWANSAGGGSFDEPFAIALDSDEDVYVMGPWGGYGNFDAIALDPWGGFVAKADGSTGAWQWANAVEGDSFFAWGDIAVDSQKNTYVISETWGDIDLDSFHIGTPYVWDAIIAKVDPSGNWEWATQMNIQDSMGFGMALSEEEDLYITGDASSAGAYFARIDKDTNELLWVEILPNVQQGNNVIVDTDNLPIFVGIIDGIQDFEGTTISNIDAEDSLVWKVANPN